MSNFILTVISGVAVALLVSWLGIGKDKGCKVLSNGFRVRKTGKWIIIISIIIIIWSFMLMGSNPNPSAGFDLHDSKTSNGLFMLIIGGFLFCVGKVVEWFQKL